MSPEAKRDSLQKKDLRGKSKPKKKPKGPKEQVIQAQVEGYLRLKGIQFLHIPDVVYRMCSPLSRIPVWDKRTISQYLKGVPDLLIFTKEADKQANTCLILELKRKNGKARDSQLAWHKGLKVFVPQSFEEAKTIIDEETK